MIRRLAVFLALFAVGAIDAQAAPQRAYPSLAKRPAESNDRFRDSASEQQPVVAAPSDPALAAEVETLARKAGEADGAFQTQLPGGRKAVTAAAGSAVSSENWVAAQMAISALDAARYESVAALASLDTLHVVRSTGKDAARGVADLATIDPARTRVLALVDAQNDTLDALRASLTTP